MTNLPKKRQSKQTKQQNGTLKRGGVTNTTIVKSWRGADSAIMNGSGSVTNKGLFFLIEYLKYFFGYFFV